MKILFTLSPLASHLRAMLPTIRAAAEAGHDVVVSTGPDLIDDLQRRGYQTWTAGPSAREAWAELNAAPPPSSVTEQLAFSASALFGRPSVGSSSGHPAAGQPLDTRSRRTRSDRTRRR